VSQIVHSTISHSGERQQWLYISGPPIQEIALRCNSKPRTIGARPTTYVPLECSTKSICTFESNRGADALNASAGNSQSSLRFSDTSSRDKLRGRCAESMPEHASKISWRHTRPLSERLDRKIPAKVAQNPASQISEAFGRLDLKL